jgi:uncharacterized protein (TIGR02118 family)
MKPSESISRPTDESNETQISTERRNILTRGAIVAAMGVTGIAPVLSSAAEAGGAKVVFIVFKRADLSREQCLAELSGEKHISIVRKIPGLKKWVFNGNKSVTNEVAPDGIGEIWFANAEALAEAFKSPEMAAAGEDAKRFADVTRTYAIVVEEKTLI